jgi:putative heme-binding domain-containing protein
VPDVPEVLVATRLLQPGDRQTLVFDAPDEPGDHPYLCTFPGHWVRMNGVMHVVASEDELAEPIAGESRDPTPAARAFVRQWTLDELAPRLAKLEQASSERGRAILEEASCLKCHQVGGQGGRTGPPLEEVVARYESRELLAQILDPSATILEGYRSEIFFLNDGGVLAGRVLEEDQRAAHVQTDPYRDETVAIAHEDVELRRVSEVSAMPEGLLTTFEAEEILDLLAWLESLRPRDDG